MQALGIVDWNAVANATTAISGAVQTGTNAYVSINNAANSGQSQNPAVQQYLTPQAPAPLPTTKSNTLMYVAIGGLGLLIVGGIVFAATRK